jgi:hypothetical protein
MSEQQPFHHLFSLSWLDLLEGTCFAVEDEIDLSRRRQLVDLVLVRKESGDVPPRLPDGFEELAAHNLVTFKSHQEALDDWALEELISHYVNYRKQATPSKQGLLPAGDFRLFAVCIRFPHNLAQEVKLSPVRQGVYEVKVVARTIRIIVVHQLPLEEQNAMLLLFSASVERLSYGKEHYRPRSGESSTLLYELIKVYSEDPEMSAKLKEFFQKSVDELLNTLPPEELRKHLSREERLKGMSPEERLEGMSREELLALVEAAKRQLGDDGSPDKPA